MSGVSLTTAWVEAAAALYPRGPVCQRLTLGGLKVPVVILSRLTLLCYFIIILRRFVSLCFVSLCFVSFQTRERAPCSAPRRYGGAWAVAWMEPLRGASSARKLRQPPETANFGVLTCSTREVWMKKTPRGDLGRRWGRREPEGLQGLCTSEGFVLRERGAGHRAGQGSKPQKSRVWQLSGRGKSQKQKNQRLLLPSI